MIKALSLTNFRRHAELDLRFDDDRQLILVAGANGTGKSSILEAITFALWGESRYGRRNLDTLVRRGAELEGMSVELTFTIGQDSYRVHRRRDGKTVTAVLYANETPLVEGTTAVTAEISSLLGMDAAGFRMAVIAQQKDLDGLSSLRPAERAQMVTRLLRLDTITAARQAASLRFRQERMLTTELRGVDPATIEQSLLKFQQTAASTSTELESSTQALTLLDAQLASESVVDTQWATCLHNQARIQGALEQLQSMATALATESAQLVVPEVSLPATDMASLLSQVALVESGIARAEEAQNSVRQQRVAADELALVSARITDVRSGLETLADVDSDAAIESLRAHVASRQLLETKLSSTHLDLGVLQGRLTSAAAHLSSAEELGADCDRCGQSITKTHRTAQIKRLQTDVKKITALLASAKTENETAAATLKTVKAAEVVLTAAVNTCKAGVSERIRLSDELVDLERRQRTYTSQVSHTAIVDVDVDSLYAQKGELAIAIACAADYAHQVNVRAAALTKQSELATRSSKTAADIADMETQLAAALPGASLSARYHARQEMLTIRAAELELQQHLRTQLALDNATVTTAHQQFVDASTRQQRYQQHMSLAVNASSAGRLLADVSERLATQIRPALEGAISSLLTTMSEGRFSAVRVSDEYNITVEDDGKFRPLGELSGGEIDLVALAVRLALSQVVTDRHGSGGTGFLILDECFASQDTARRQSILTALRTLVDTYSQIFIISHVENIEDAADMVINVSTDDTRAETEVTVS